MDTNTSEYEHTPLEAAILLKLPHLSKIEPGQRFYSPYYGIITATKIDDLGGGRYSVYGYDKEKGLPRDNYYPKDLTLVGKNIMMNDVIAFYKKTDYVDGINMMMEYVEVRGIKYITDKWDLSKPYLEDQNQELISWLTRLI